MADEFRFDVLLNKRSNDESVVRPRAERLTKDRQDRSRLLVLGVAANAFGSDWAQLECDTVRLRLDYAPSTCTDLKEHRVRISTTKTSSGLP